MIKCVHVYMYTCNNTLPLTLVQVKVVEKEKMRMNNQDTMG